MKRSEFLERLRLEGEKRLPYAWDYCTPDEMLSIIESLGMVPPDRLPAAVRFSTNERRMDREEWIYTRFSWEPEDE